MNLEVVLKDLDDAMHEERLRELWRDWGKYLIAAIVLILAGVGGYEAFHRHQAKNKAEEAKVYFDAAGKNLVPEALPGLETLSKSGSPVYRALAAFRMAAIQVEQSKLDDAQKTYRMIHDDHQIPALYRDLGTVMLAQMLLDSEADEAHTLLQGLITNKSAYTPSAYELLAMQADNKGDKQTAMLDYQHLISLENAPTDMVQRATERLHALEGESK